MWSDPPMTNEGRSLTYQSPQCLGNWARTYWEACVAPPHVLAVELEDAYALQPSWVCNPQPAHDHKFEI